MKKYIKINGYDKVEEVSYENNIIISDDIEFIKDIYNISLQDYIGVIDEPMFSDHKKYYGVVLYDDSNGDSSRWIANNDTILDIILDNEYEIFYINNNSNVEEVYRKILSTIEL